VYLAALGDFEFLATDSVGRGGRFERLRRAQGKENSRLFFCFQRADWFAAPDRSQETQGLGTNLGENLLD
jgi:hypothetical protein